MSAPVWHRLACEMAREGYSVAEIAEEFGEDPEAVAVIVAGHAPADRRRTKAHAERMRARQADPVFAAAHTERMRRMNVDPDFAAANAERMRARMRALHADPAFRAAHAERMRRLHADPAFRARAGRRPKWCPPERLAEYRELCARIGRVAAKAQILAGTGPARGE